MKKHTNHFWPFYDIISYGSLVLTNFGKNHSYGTKGERTKNGKEYHSQLNYSPRQMNFAVDKHLFLQTQSNSPSECHWSKDQSIDQSSFLTGGGGWVGGGRAQQACSFHFVGCFPQRVSTSIFSQIELLLVFKKEI